MSAIYIVHCFRSCDGETVHDIAMITTDRQKAESFMTRLNVQDPKPPLFTIQEIEDGAEWPGV